MKGWVSCVDNLGVYKKVNEISFEERTSHIHCTPCN